MAETRDKGLAKSLPHMSIVIPISAHFVFVCFALIDGWLPPSYGFSHLCLFLLVIWAVQLNMSALPLVTVLAVLIFTIILDIITLGVYFGRRQEVNSGGKDTSARIWQFSAAMCILNLLLKPVTAVLITVSIYKQHGCNCARMQDTPQDQNSVDGSYGSDRPPSTQESKNSSLGYQQT